MMTVQRMARWPGVLIAASLGELGWPVWQILIPTGLT